MSKRLTPGDKAPDFELPDDQNGVRSLKSYAGQKLVLYFYPKDDTTGCTKEALDFSALKDDFERIGTSVLGVSPDTLASHAKFKTKHKLGLDLASDTTTSMLQAYGVWTEKSMYGRKYMGVERTTFLIDRNGRIAAIWNKVKVPDHAETVFQAARDLA